MSKRGGLGRGLSALIPGAPEAGEGSEGLLEVPANAIAPNPKQPRSRFDDETLAELAASIREVGILQPIVVRRTDGGYEVVAGERRLRAAKLAGLATVPVVLRDSEDADLLREALIENIHREDLNPIELGEAFRQLLDDLGLKQEELADRVGVSRDPSRSAQPWAIDESYSTFLRVTSIEAIQFTPSSVRSWCAVCVLPSSLKTPVQQVCFPCQVQVSPWMVRSC